jgi:tRNA threonylcarbamoyladenosine biosynthesis protein TsaB
VTLLGFDTSTNATSVAVLTAGGESFEHDAGPAALLGRPRHAEELLPSVARVMGEAGAGWEDIEAIAVGVGPGTFTGLRIGVATARALAQARRIPLKPVISLSALAAGLDPARERLALIDARRGELFAALHGPGGERWPPFVATPDELAARIRADANPARPALAAGDGSIRFRQVLETAGVEVPPDDSRLHLVRALHICRLAGGVPATPPETVVPLYLREPDAKPRETP